MVVLMLPACNRAKKRELNNLVDSFYGKQLYTADSLLIVCKGSVIGTVKEFDKYKRIITYINGDCPECIIKLREWDEFMSINSKNKEVKLQIMVSSNNFYFFESVCEQMHFDRPVVYDTNASFISKNILNDAHLHTLLVDSNNMILLIGNPLNNKKLTDLYIRKF
jgi:hypothetical protein